MEKKNSQMYNIDIKNTKEIYDFCLLNKIMDIDGFINKCFKKGFNLEKYGIIGEVDNEIKEIIVEKRVEVPVEVIVEKIVEIIKEVPTPPTEVKVIEYVDREVIKEIKVEVPVEKIVYIYDKTSSELEEKIFHLEQELDGERRKFSTKTEEMSKKDKELDEIRRSLDINLDENKTKMLTDTLTKLRKEISEKNQLIEELKNKIKELETIKINQGAVFMKGSNLTKNL